MPTKDLHNMREETFNYFKRLVSDKMEKRDLLISLILFGSVFVVSWWLGGPVGGFSFVLAAATIWNVKVTRGLVSRSEEAFKQSRISFLVSIVERTIDHLKREEDMYVHHQERAVEYIEGKTKGINRISPEGGLEFLEAMIDWSREGGLIKTKLEKFRKDYFRQN